MFLGYTSPFGDRTHMTPAVMKSMLDQLPVNIMTCDLKTYRIDYANTATLKTLETIEHALPIKAAELVGSSIDVFHKNPAHQHGMLLDESNLPHAARIEIGGEILDLLVTPLRDAGGRYIAPMVTWQLVTDQVAQENQTAQLMKMLNDMPINVMLADPETCAITYANRTTIETLKTIEHLLPIKAEDLIGQSIDIFHKKPQRQRTMLADPGNLPHNAKIRLGDETLDLRVSAVHDKDGRYTGAMVSWSVVTKQVDLANRFESDVKGVVDTVSAAATELQSTSESLSATAEQTSNQSQVVATAAEELTASINEISRQVQTASEKFNDAVAASERSTDSVDRLSQAVGQIGEVVQLIKDIADQTNLLALNATIEAARAGETGKGFAVVASEVKALATQTATATDDITKQIASVKSATEDSVGSIAETQSLISELSAISTAISSAVEEQSAATAEVTNNITGVEEASRETGRSSVDMVTASSQLSTDAETLAKTVDDFLVMVRSL